MIQNWIDWDADSLCMACTIKAITTSVSMLEDACRSVLAHIGFSLGAIFIAFDLSSWRFYTKEDLNKLLSGTLRKGNKAKPEMPETIMMLAMSVPSI